MSRPSDIGILECLGTFRIKKHKETDARRVLLRNSTNGKVNMVSTGILEWLTSMPVLNLDFQELQNLRELKAFNCEEGAYIHWARRRRFTNLLCSIRG